MNALPLILFFLLAATLAYRYYSVFLAAKVAVLDDSRVTPAHRFEDGQNYVPTNKWVLFGHHFAAISGAGPLIGPVLAAQFGYAPGLLWITIGVVLAGAVHDFITLASSVRRGGQVAGRDRARGDRPRGGNDGHDRHPRYRHRGPRRPRHRGGERARGIALGGVHDRLHDPHRPRGRRLHALRPPARHPARLDLRRHRGAPGRGRRPVHRGLAARGRSSRSAARRSPSPSPPTASWPPSCPSGCCSPRATTCPPT